MPHAKFGNHLDSQGRTIDADLESFWGKIWLQTTIGKHLVVAEYIEDTEEEILLVSATKSEE